MASMEKQQTIRNPAVKLPPPMTDAPFIQLSSGDSDSGVSDDDAESVIDTSDTASVKRPRVSVGGTPLKKPKPENNIVPVGFLYPLLPGNRFDVVIASPISIVPPEGTAALRKCKQFWKAGDYDGQSSAADSNSVLGN